MDELINISAVVLAAGESTRMGKSKLSLPWEATNIIGTVCDKFRKNGVKDIVVVLGGYSDEVNAALKVLPFYGEITIKMNLDPAHTEMIDSVKIGIPATSPNSTHVFIALGDNPQVSHQAISDLISARDKAQIIIPSYQMRRGHPWLVSRTLLSDLQSVPKGCTMRDWLNSHQNEIWYIDADETVLKDIDTPKDYIEGNMV